MGNNATLQLLKDDRIISINGFDMKIDDSYNGERRNIKCYSKQLNKYIEENNLSEDVDEHITLIWDLINDGVLTDIVVLSVRGYY